ncbi:2'-5' RNA ligase family protein [Actinoplanes missouriensis]|uniref:hypothetical protein n=1 Tax=Actinoplanes missouriensis TaxID=1866 RepID=UPI0012FC937C|nr:hypothetical protein [Actinoplanes missouriensis]
MAYGVVLVPDAGVSRALVDLSQEIGAGREPLMLLGDDAPPHVSVLHADCADDRIPEMVTAAHPYRERSFEVTVIGLLYAVVPPGDYYVPSGGYYFGLEVIRRPGLDELHREFLGLGMPALGLVGEDFRPHITLGVTTQPPALPPLERVPAGSLRMTMASGPVGPFGTFPELTGV